MAAASAVGLGDHRAPLALGLHLPRHRVPMSGEVAGHDLDARHLTPRLMPSR
jgi:hypothetical protein